MASTNKKISELTDGSPPQSGDQYPFARSTDTLKVTYAQLLAAVTATLQTTGTVNTTDATPTAVSTIAIASNTTVMIQATVSARRTGGSSGTTGDGAGYILNAAVKNIAGTVTIIGQSLAFAQEDQAAWNVAAAVSTTNIEIRVTGAANNNITWVCTYKTVTA